MKAFWWWVRLSVWTRWYYGHVFPLAEVTGEDGCWNGYFTGDYTPREAVLEDLSYA